MKKAGIVLLCILLIGALTVPAIAEQGCSLGFWKNHTDVWPMGYSPSDLVGSVFTVPADYSALASITLIDALKFKGGRGSIGGARILLRQAVAAVLNAAHSGVSYRLTEDEVISAVDLALASLHRDTIVDLAQDLDADNNGGCPIDEE